MAEITCIEGGCDNPARSRDLCPAHYGKAYRAGMIPKRRPSRLTDIDESSLTVTCLVHGPGSRLRIRSGDRGRYACRSCDGGGRGNRRAQRARAYGIAYEEYLVLAQAQGNKCLICRQPPPEGRALAVDHDHSTGAVRGLLCHGCNVALGFMKDSPENLVRAARYLRRKTG